MFGSKGTAGKAPEFAPIQGRSSKSSPQKAAASEVKQGVKTAGTGANNKLPK